MGLKKGVVVFLSDRSCAINLVILERLFFEQINTVPF